MKSVMNYTVSQDRLLYKQPPLRISLLILEGFILYTYHKINRAPQIQGLDKYFSFNSS